MSSRTVGKRCDLKPVLEVASHTNAQLVRADINAHEDLDRSLRFSTFFHNHPRDGIRLSSGSPTLYHLSRRPCECRLKRPRILHGVGKEGGGPIYNPGCQLTAPKEMNGLPPKPDPISHLPRDRRDRAVTSKIQGVDFHPGWQQVAWIDSETGETGEQKLVHASGDAKWFYEQLAAPVLIGMEATGNSPWFVELVEDLGHEIWIGDAAQIRAGGPPFRVFCEGWVHTLLERPTRPPRRARPHRSSAMTSPPSDARSHY